MIDLSRVRAIDVHVHADVSCHDPEDPVDRYDGQHYGSSGQEKYTDAWIRLFRAHAGL